MPWLPVFRGPLPPAFLASSSRAFLSVANELEVYSDVFLRFERRPTGLELGLVCLVILVFLDDLLLGLLVVNRVGTRWEDCQCWAHTASSRGDTYIPFLKASWRLCGVSWGECDLSVTGGNNMGIKNANLYVRLHSAARRATLLAAALPLPLITFLSATT